MYEYRRLSDDERAEIKRLRLQQGYPLHAPPHPSHESGYFLITAAAFEHKHILSSSARRTEFELKILNGFNRQGSEVLAWVVLPNHYHALVSIDDFRVVPQIVRLLHGSTSREWNLQDGTLGRKVWFKYSDRRIRGDRHYFATLNYIHHNPMKHGYAAVEADWHWSSIHLFLADYGADWLQRTSEEYPVLNYGRKWDD